MPLPYAPPLVYDPTRSGVRIADLIMHQGDIAARNAAAQGQIWGSAVQNIGQIAAGAYQQHREEKVQKRREALFGEAVSSWDDNDPRGSVMRLAKVVGPQDAVKFGQGMMSFRKSELSPQELQSTLHAAAVLRKNAPGMFDQQYPMIAQKLGPMLQQQYGVTLPEKPDEQVYSYLEALGNPQKEGGDFTLGEGQVRYGPDGKVLATGPAAAAKTDARVVGRSLVAPDGRVIYRDPEASSEKPKKYEVEVPGPNGTVVKRLVSEAELQAGVTMAPKSTGQKPVSGAERQSLAFYNRANDAVSEIDDLENRIAKRSYAAQAYNAAVPNVLKSEDQQLYEQRQRSFTEARLRKESGAAIPESEFENDKRTYWAVPGDSPKLIEQKRQKRKTVLDGLRYSAGKAYDEYYGEPAPKELKAGGTKKIGRFTVEVE